ncbi:MAG: cytoplasmic protein [Candidatus Sericytochromatia bacterium]|nr:cytoplasmic protein [Candidatus Sericytochromatia bacterium]
MDIARAERESLRWMILLALNHARPTGTTDHVLVRTAQDIYLTVTVDVIQRELDYLKGLGLVSVTRSDDNPLWHASLTSAGVDVVEYRENAPKGVARPRMY